MLLLDKTLGRYVPVRVVAFAQVGGLGVLVHLAVVAALYVWNDVAFLPAQATSTYVAMTFNHVVNNVLTYRDRRLHGWAWVRGWTTFTLACSVGALANVGIASCIFESQSQWLLAAVAGILVGAVWNYAVTMVYTWNRPTARRATRTRRRPAAVTLPIRGSHAPTRSCILDPWTTATQGPQGRAGRDRRRPAT